jgi:ribonuclease Z
MVRLLVKAFYVQVFDLTVSSFDVVSATLVDIPDSGSILLDAGENTYGQMLRMMGRDGIDKAINNLKAIFVSHLHADHHLGVVHILAKWFEVCFANKTFIPIIYFF